MQLCPRQSFGHRRGNGFRPSFPVPRDVDAIGAEGAFPLLLFTRCPFVCLPLSWASGRGSSWGSQASRATQPGRPGPGSLFLSSFSSSLLLSGGAAAVKSMHHMRKREAHMKINFILSIFFVSLENTSVRKLFYSQTKIYPIHEAGSQLSRGKGYTFFLVLHRGRGKYTPQIERD